MSTDAQPGRTAARLLAWLSPAFPTGGFAHSHGLEWAVEAGELNDEASLLDWLDALLRHGAPRSDAVLLCHAHRAAALSDHTALAELVELAAALAPGHERQLETLSQGRAFVAAASSAWTLPVLERLGRDAGAARVAYPVAVGAAAGETGLPLDATLPAFLHATLSTLVSAAVRLVPLGQTAGLRVLARMEAPIEELAREAPELGLDALGSAVFRADLASMHHETQSTRLFRT